MESVKFHSRLPSVARPQRRARQGGGIGPGPSVSAQFALGAGAAQPHHGVMPRSPAHPPDPALRAGFVPQESEEAIARDLLRPALVSAAERLVLLAFDGWGRLCVARQADGGAADRCPIPTDCWRALAAPGVTEMIMAHNHPSGIPWPSETDCRCTRRVVESLDLFGIGLVDHLIFVERGHFSFRRSGLL